MYETAFVFQEIVQMPIRLSHEIYTIWNLFFSN